MLALEARVTPLVDLLVETFPRVVSDKEESSCASSGSGTAEEEDLEEVNSGDAVGAT